MGLLLPRRIGMQSAPNLVVLILLLVLSACNEPIPPLAIDKGQVFPVMVVFDLKGQPRPLAIPQNKVTVLNIWATWCAPCRYEMPSLQKLADQLDPAHFQVVGLSIDDENYTASEFLIERKIRFSNYHDPAQRISKKLLALRAYPTTYILLGNRVHRVVEGGQDWGSPHWVAELQALESNLTQTADTPSRHPN